MKPMHLVLMLMCLAALFVLSACQDDDDDHSGEIDYPLFADWYDYWNYAQDRQCVLFAHVSDHPMSKEGLMFVTLWVDKLPDNFSPDDDIAMYINGQPMYLYIYQDHDNYYLYSDDLQLPQASGITVRFDYDGNTLIDQCIMIPKTPDFTTVTVSSPSHSADMAWTVPENSQYQVLELWGRYIADEDNISYFMDPHIRSKIIPANTLALPNYSQWEATISANNLIEYRNSALIAQTWDDFGSYAPTGSKDKLARIKAMHLRKLN